MADNLTTVGSFILETFEGNTRTFLIRLRKKRTRQPFDASGADKFKFEFERHEVEGETLFTPIETLPTDPLADFLNGVVPMTVTPAGTSPITKVKGTYAFSMTMVVGTADVTIATGQLEVAERPGFAPPP